MSSSGRLTRTMRRREAYERERARLKGQLADALAAERRQG